jgi:regulator of nonsense transcripts 3
MGTPQLLSRKTNGVTGGQSSSDAPKAPRVKAPPQGEKVVIRRLPPAMTEDEFVTILGDEWRVGRAKVDWFSYWPGKVSQQSVIPLPSRPAEPANPPAPAVPQNHHSPRAHTCTSREETS